jgi:hypothetical protein
LNDLLELYSAPTDIDYISLDTEGSEYNILKTFNFSKYNVKCFTIEYGNEENRQQIFELLSINGYTKVDDEYTGQEDWYVKN